MKLLTALLFIGLSITSYAMHTDHSKPTSAVTYELNGGRLGDNLMTYAMAQWIARKYGLPFLYVPFPYSDQFVLHNHDQSLNLRTAKYRFAKQVYVKYHHEATISFTPDTRTLYVINNGFHLHQEESIFDMQDPEFRAFIKGLVQLRTPLPRIGLPTDAFTLAVHVRKGGGYDKPLLHGQDNPKLPRNKYSDWRYPLRFPPDEYYLNQIRTVATMVGKKVYAYVFTDAPNPQALCDQYQAALADLDITFACRTTGNKHDAHVIEDLFAMTQFDGLIRPQSNYSQWAQFLGDFSIVVWPTKYQWQGTRLVIEQVGIKQKDIS